MKTRLLLLTIFALVIFCNKVNAQCIISHSGDTSLDPEEDGILWGQSFTAECDGYLEYVAFYAVEAGIQNFGTLYIYNGNPEFGSLVYQQDFEDIVIANANDEIGFNLSESFEISNGEEYTFEFLVTVPIYYSFGGYDGGQVIQDGMATGFENFDFGFKVSISDTPPIPNGCTITCVENQERPFDEGQDYYTVMGDEFNPTVTCTNSEMVSLVNDFNNEATLDGAQVPDNTIIVWTVVDTANNTKQCSFNLNLTTDINEERKLKVSLYPVPASDYVIVRLNHQDFSGSSKLTFQITDFLGRTIETYDFSSVDEYKFDIQHLNKGVYLLTVSDKTLKFVKK